MEEVPKQSACSIDRILRAQHDVRIDIYEQHTEGDRNQKKWLEALGDGKIQENECDDDHQHISPCHAYECCLLEQVC